MAAASPHVNTSQSRLLARLMGARIAQKIFTGYVLGLTILVAFGIVLPLLFWSYLGRTVHAYDGLAQLTDNAVALRRAAVDTEGHVGAFIRYRDVDFEDEYAEARNAYRQRYREVYQAVENRSNPTLQRSIDEVGKSFNEWVREDVHRPYSEAKNSRATSAPSKTSVAQAERVHRAFTPVEKKIEMFVVLVDGERARLLARSHAAELMRELTTIFIPSIALLLSLLIGRSTALGITRPLGALMRATRDLERGAEVMPLYLEESAEAAPDDEIGDLQRAFRQMARTIGQREAVLHAQNEAVGALHRRIEAVLNATNDGILMLDRAGGFSVVNQRLADLFGIEIDHLLDHTFGQAGPLLLSRFKNKVAVRRRLQSVFDDPEEIADETFDLSEPHGRTIRIYSAPVRGHRYRADGADSEAELLGRIFVFRDVTRETMLDRMKTEFVSTVSHELRTPLTGIKGYIDLMVSGQTGPMNEIQMEFLTLAQGSARRLTSLINDMLDVSRIESGRMELQQESIAYLPLVQQTIRMMQQEADERGIALTLQMPSDETAANLPQVRGDAGRVTQVLTNFLSNGIKYTPPGGHVTVSVEFEDDFVTTCVEDDGIGISTIDQRRLFQKFFRADNSTTREAGGTGLGLAITKAILEKLNGSVWVDSAKGEGSRFYFTLPCAAPLVVESAAAAFGREDAAVHPSYDNSGALILPISGDLSALHRIGHELRRRGFVTSGASTAAEALRRVHALRPDIILLDPLTHDFDGRELLKSLAAQSEETLPPVLIASIHVSDADGALLRDDVALLPAEAVSCDTLLSILRTALDRAAGLLQEDQENAQHANNGILVLDPGSTLSPRVTEALRIIDAQENVAIIRIDKWDRLMPYLTANGETHTIVAIIIGDSTAAPLFDVPAIVTRLRRRRPDAFLACVLLMEDAVFARCRIRAVAPIGGGAQTNAVCGDEIMKELRAREITNAAL